MKNKIIKIFAVFLVVMTAVIIDTDINIFSTDASAATASGQFNNNISWSYNNSTKTLTVSGTGDMPNYTTTPSVFTSNNSTVGVVIKTDATKIVINSGITHVGQFAFYGFSNVTSVSFPSTVKTIGASSFQSCTKITSITIPSSVTVIGKSVFEGCTSLSDITLNEGLTQISSYCFKNTKISSITAPSTLKTIGQYAFTGCQSLSSVTLNSGLTALDSYAFHNCTGLVNITIPSGIATVKDYVFNNCTSLTTVVFAEGVKSFSAHTFNGCTALDTLTLPSTFTLSKSVFEGNTTLKNIILAEGCKSVGERAFYGCTGLTSITIPSTVTTLGKSAFEGCTSLAEVNLSEGLKSIGAYCFKLTKFTNVDLPFSVTSIGTHAFAAVSGLNIFCNYGDAAYNYCRTHNLSYTLRTPELKVNAYLDENANQLKVILMIQNASGFNAANLNLTYTGGIAPVSTEVGSVENSDIIGTIVYNSPGNISIALMSAECIPYSACTGECEYTIAQLVFDVLGTSDTATITLSSKAFMLDDTRFTVDPIVKNTDLYLGGTHIHSYDSGVVTDAATCIKTGMKIYTCSVCGDEKSEIIPIDSSYHAGETEIQNAVTENCISEGYTGDLHCKDCNEKLETGTTIPATGIHTYDDEVTTAATCCETGIMTYTCSVCGDSYEEEIAINANNHTGGTKIINDKTATCGDEGYTGDTYCLGCNKKIADGEEIPATGHDWGEWTTVTPATCEEDGLEKRICKNDTSHVEENTLSATGHTEEAIKGYAATCTETGLTDGEKCSVCGEAITEQKVIPAKGHDWGEWTTVTPATCEEDGLEKRICKNDTSHVEENTLSATGHAEETIKGFAATCTETGLTDGEKCSVCGETITEQKEIPAKGHDWGEWTTVTPATCEEGGLEKRICKKDSSHVEENTLSATGHTEEAIGGRDATCTETGLTKGVKCSVCGEILTAQQVIPAKGHDWGEWTTVTPATCEEGGLEKRICKNDSSHVEENTLSATGHNYDKVVTEPTCTEDGYTTYTCTCGDTYTSDEVPATGHNYDKVITEPTCTEDGYTTYICTCGDTYTADEVPATGHNYDKVVTEPTCTEDGYTTYTCTCGDTYTADEVPATGHNYDKVVTEPTCTEDGYTTYTCTCGDTYTDDEIPATGHDYARVVTTSATCHTEGLMTYTCSVCEDSYEDDIPVDADNHVGGTEIRDEVTGNCGEAGYTGDTYCKGCEAKIKTGTTIPATGKHTYDAGKETKPATCIATGVKTYTCSVCGDSYEEEIAINANNHTGRTEIKEDKPATCAETGYTGNTYCKDCGEKIKTGTTVDNNLNNHTGGTKIINNKTATCGEAGYTGDTYCKGCEAKIKTGTTIPATGKHDYVGVVSAAATCKTKGVMTYTCGVCGDTYDKEIAINVNNHTGGTKIINDKTATCGDEGYTGDTYCLGCNKKIATGKKIPATGKHSYDSGTVTKAATCTATGVKTYKCKVCGATKTDVVSVLGHSYSTKYTVDKAATCTEPGSKSQHCTRSGCTAKQNVTPIAATGHSYDSGTVTKAATCTATGVKTYKCKVCGSTKTDVVPVLGHSYSAKYTVDKEATCTTDGSKSQHCTRSGCTVKQNVTPIAATGHSYDSGTVTKAATCTATGVKTYKCKVCGSTKTDVVPVLGHSYSTKYTVDKEATCTTAGSKSQYCTRNGCSAKQNVTPIAATGHSYDSGTVTKAATCTEKGVEVYTCKVCGSTKTEDVAMLGHSYSAKYTVDKEATCTTDGSKSQHCTRCSAKQNVTVIAATGHEFDKNGKCKHCDEVNVTEITFVPDSGLSVYNVTDDETQNTTQYVISLKPVTAKDFNSLIAGDGWTVTDDKNNAVETGKNVATSNVIRHETGIEYVCVILGDVNLDGNVTAADARLALRYAASLEKLSDVQAVASDADFKNGVLASDARKILRVSAKLDKFQ